MAQIDVERGQEFRKCIECFLCQNTCHVVRDHEDNKPAFAGPRFFLRYAELDMHPLDTHDRRELAQGAAGIGMCNITKCCTEVCPEGIKITDNAIIPMKERVVDRKYDPLVWLGNKIGIRNKDYDGRDVRARSPTVHVHTHRLTFDADVVRKRFVSWDDGEADREWAGLVALAQHAPGLAPRPIERELDGDAPVIVMSRVPGEPLGEAPLTPDQADALTTALRRLFAATRRRTGHPSAPLGPSTMRGMVRRGPGRSTSSARAATRRSSARP